MREGCRASKHLESQSGRKPLAAALDVPSSHTSSAPVLAPPGREQRGSGRPAAHRCRQMHAAGEAEWVVWRLRVASSDQRSEGQLRSKIG